jgi:hypothetical protein
LYLEGVERNKDSGDGAMDKIQDRSAIANLPVAGLAEELGAFLAPVAAELPDERLRRGLARAVRGIVGSQSPVVTEVARGLEREREHVWPLAKRLYRFLANGRFGHRQLLRGLVRIARRAASAYSPARSRATTSMVGRAASQVAVLSAERSGNRARTRWRSRPQTIVP